MQYLSLKTKIRNIVIKNIINDRKIKSRGITYSKIFLIVLLCVLGHINSNKNIHRIFYIFLYFPPKYAKNPGG